MFANIKRGLLYTRVSNNLVYSKVFGSSSSRLYATITEVKQTPSLNKTIPLAPTKKVVHRIAERILKQKPPQSEECLQHKRIVRRLKHCEKTKNVNKISTIMEDIRINGFNYHYSYYRAAINAAIRCRENDMANKYFAEMKEKGFTPKPQLYSFMINSCKFNKDIETAEKYMDELLSKHVVKQAEPFTNLMNVYVRVNNIDGVMNTLQKMKELGIERDVTTYGAVLKYHAKFEQLDKGLEVFEMAKEDGVEPDLYMYTMLIDCCKMPHQKDEAVRIFEEMQEKGIARNTITYQTLMHKLFQAGEYEEVYNLFERMKQANVRPTPFCLYVLLRTAHRDNFNMVKGRGYWREFKKLCIKPNELTAGALKSLILGFRQARAEEHRAEREKRKEYKSRRLEIIEYSKRIMKEVKEAKDSRDYHVLKQKRMQEEAQQEQVAQ